MVTGAAWAADVGSTVDAACAGADVASAEAEPAGAEPARVECSSVVAPDWRPLIAVTRSPLRILAVPVKPRLPARP